MKKTRITLIGLALFFFFVVINAQENKPKQVKEPPKTFVDKNGDGYNDNAPDHDGDGIPNCVDPDYKGQKMQKKKFVDLNGDGINDNAANGKAGFKGKGKYGAGKNTAGINPSSSEGTQNSKGRGYKGGKK